MIPTRCQHPNIDLQAGLFDRVEMHNAPSAFQNARMTPMRIPLIFGSARIFCLGTRWRLRSALLEIDFCASAENH